MKKWQCKKKWVVDSFSKLQTYFAFAQFWNLWLNLCSFKWLIQALILWEDLYLLDYER